VRFTPSNSEQR